MLSIRRKSTASASYSSGLIPRHPSRQNEGARSGRVVQKFRTGRLGAGDRTRRAPPAEEQVARNVTHVQYHTAPAGRRRCCVDLNHRQRSAGGGKRVVGTAELLAALWQSETSKARNRAGAWLQCVFPRAKGATVEIQKLLET